MGFFSFFPVRVLMSESKCLIFSIFMALKRAFYLLQRRRSDLFGAGVLSDSLGTFRDGVFCQLTRQQKSNSCLDFPTGDCWSFVVVGQTRRFSSDSFENVVHERIHDRHGLAGNTSVGMDLFQDFVDVDSETFLPALLPLLFVTGTDALLSLSGFFDSLSWSLWGHFVTLSIEVESRNEVWAEISQPIYTTGGIPSPHFSSSQ